jgi:Bacteriophage Lambda NinG protein
MKLRERVCKHCRARFQPWRSFQSCCSVACAVAYSRTREERRLDLLRRRAKRDIRERLQKLKTRRDWMKETQAAFNAFIRERDDGLPCICCSGEPMLRPLTGGQWDAGHYRSRGAAPQLRFDEDNCHRQRKQCNRDGSGRAVEYRRGLIARIGIERVERIENNHELVRWTIDDLRALKLKYQQKRRDLRAQRREHAQILEQAG